MSKQRAHSKYSASGANIWHNCPGSVKASEGVPDKDNKWSLEGTEAHAVLESLLRNDLLDEPIPLDAPEVSDEMVVHAKSARRHILREFSKCSLPRIMIEERVLLDFIHPEAFGSLDVGIVEPYGTLHIMDYKYGKTMVSPVKNLQFIFYALAVAYRWDWNFKRVRMWTLQPRAGGNSFWEITIKELKEWIPVFRAAVDRVEKYPDRFKEGSWCHWCKAGRAGKCPLKGDVKKEKALTIFGYKEENYGSNS